MPRWRRCLRSTLRRDPQPSLRPACWSVSAPATVRDAPADTASVGSRGYRHARSWRRSASWSRDSPRSMPCVMSPDEPGVNMLLALIAGLVFGTGLIVSGMFNPAKVLGFLDLAGRWDPSLAIVMVTAVPVAAAAFA